jgi:hypothetical protein
VARTGRNRRQALLRIIMMRLDVFGNESSQQGMAAE